MWALLLPADKGHLSSEEQARKTSSFQASLGIKVRIWLARLAPWRRGTPDGGGASSPTRTFGRPWLSQGLCTAMTWGFWSLSAVFHLSAASPQLLQQSLSEENAAPQGSSPGSRLQFPMWTWDATPSQTCVSSGGGGHLNASQKRWIKSSYQRRNKTSLA